MASISSAFNKMNVIFLALLLVLIMAGELILEPMHLATWPAFS
jgi:dipeptide/tripeptide permease